MDYDIEIVPFKRSKYDRGSRKIIVNGVEWGYYVLEAHGCHGPSYHAHDFHGEVMVPYANNRGKKLPVSSRPLRQPDSFRAQSERQHFRSQIGKPENEKTKHQPVLDQLAEHARGLIRNGYLRNPAVRAKEVADQRERYRLTVEAADKQERDSFDARIDSVLQGGESSQHGLGPQGKCLTFQVDELRKAIAAAMKWAQAQ